MTADVFAALQALPNTQTQTPQPALQQNSSGGNTNALREAFASLMNECIAEKPEQMLVLPEVGNDQKFIAFTSSNSFPQSVMNILAGEAEKSPDTPSPETISLTENEMPSQEIADDSDKVFWPDDETAAELPNAPEATQLPKIADAPDTTEDAALPENPEPVIASDVHSEVQAPVQTDNAPLKVPAKLAHVSEHVSEEEDESEDTQEPEESHDTEEPQEIPEVSAEMAGLAGVVNTQPQNTTHTEIQDSQTQPEKSAVFSQPTRQRRTQPETHTSTREQQNVTENREVNINFREALVNRNTDPENSGQDSQQDTHSNNQNQNQSQNQTRKAESRNIKPESPTQTPAQESRRTESHSDFGAYFEGVLNSRRSTARISNQQAMPLNLRSAENFSQAATLRDGLTNIVRFIRADGVQKARVIVDPPALGRISVELTSGTSGVEASIKVASEQIRQLVQDQISQLRMNLSQQGVQVAEFTVDVQQDNSGNHGQQGQENNAGRFGFVDDSDSGDDETENFRIDLNEGLLYWVA